MSIFTREESSSFFSIRKIDEALPWLLSIPVSVLYTLFLAFPLALLFLVSVPAEEPLANYVAVFADPGYRNSLLLSVAISVFVTVVSVILALFMAYFIGRRDFAGKRVIVAIISFPVSLPGILVAWAVIVMIGRSGIITQLLTAVLGGEAAGYSSAFGLVGLLIGYTYFTLPRATMSLISSFEALDSNLEEAARSLGASKLATFKHVILPEIAPGIGSAVVLSFSVCMAAFGTALLLASGDVPILPLKIYSIVLGLYDYAAASALAVVLTVITVGVIYGYTYLFGGKVYE
jgi:putative spermidine/putrescine transport system permease protein